MLLDDDHYKMFCRSKLLEYNLIDTVIIRLRLTKRLLVELDDSRNLKFLFIK